MTAIGHSPLVRRWRTAATRFTTPLLPDDYLTLVNPLWSARELRGRIVSVTPEAEDAATIVVEPGWGWSFSHAAGQYIGIGVQIDGRFVWRSYSLTTPPSRDGKRLVVTVRAMPEGFASRHLVHGVEPGTIVRLAPPAGEFVLPDPLPGKVLMLTAGSGITPIMAMLRGLDRRHGAGSHHDVTVVHSAPDADRALFAEELDLLARRHPGWRIVQRHTRAEGHLDLTPAGPRGPHEPAPRGSHEGNPRADRATGSSPRAMLEELVPDWRERETWACGPTAMLDAAEKAWADAGARDALHLERFSADLTGGEAEGGTITFARSGRSVDVDGATTVLEAGENAGIPMPFGCRMGICHTCVAPLRSGAVRDLRDGAEARVMESGATDSACRTVQTCVSAASGDCVIDL